MNASREAVAAEAGDGGDDENVLCGVGNGQNSAAIDETLAGCCICTPPVDALLQCETTEETEEEEGEDGEQVGPRKEGVGVEELLDDDDGKS